jgi:hypothetical protein
MSDIVERLDTVVGSPIAADAKREILSLRQQLAECRAEKAKLWKAAENLIAVRGRFNTEQAFKNLKAIVAELEPND